MMLEYLLGANPIKTAAANDFEEKRITKQDKDVLDKVIAKESKQGWLVKSRSHDSEGNHGVVMARRMGEPALG
jgi:hypothetical protein